MIANQDIQRRLASFLRAEATRSDVVRSHVARSQVAWTGTGRGNGTNRGNGINRGGGFRLGNSAAFDLTRFYAAMVSRLPIRPERPGAVDPVAASRLASTPFLLRG